MKFEGAITALITPFKGANVDEEALIKLIQRQLEAGISGLVVLGTTGEFCTLNEYEQSRVIEIACHVINKKIPLIVGTGTFSTQETIEKTLRAKSLGADAALIIAPYFNKPSQNGLYHHFAEIDKLTDIPIIVYNHPGRSAVNIELETMKDIIKLKNVVAIKDCPAEQNYLQELIKYIDHQKPQLSVLSSDDMSTLSMIKLGAKGVISAVANLYPEDVIDLVTAVLAKNYTRAELIQQKLMPIFETAFLETNPVPIKKALESFGLCSAAVRLPLVEMEKENELKLLDALNSTLQYF